jgi:hypothetical protein
LLSETSPRNIAITLDVFQRGFVHKNADRVLNAQLEQLREFWSDLFLILQSDENICINEKLAASHVLPARACLLKHIGKIAGARIRNAHEAPAADRAA